MAADFQNVSSENVSLLVSGVGGRFRTQLQHCRWKLVKFCSRASACRHLSYIEGRQCGCWLLVFLTKCGWCSNQTDEIVAFFSKTNNFPSGPIKRLALTTGSSAAMFIVDMYPDPDLLASENSDQMKRFNLFRFLSGKNAVPFSLEKTTENSIQMVSVRSVISHVTQMPHERKPNHVNTAIP